VVIIAFKITKIDKNLSSILEKMDYGTGSLTNKGPDGGIDGIIDEDELGLSKIYIQAKRYKDSSNIGR
jgi:mrr restriction system protein